MCCQPVRDPEDRIRIQWLLMFLALLVHYKSSCTNYLDMCIFVLVSIWLWKNECASEIFLKIKRSHPIWSCIGQWYVSWTLHISMLFTAHLKQKLLIVAPGKLYMDLFLFESGRGGGRKVSLGQVAVASAGAMPKEAQIRNDEQEEYSSTCM